MSILESIKEKEPPENHTALYAFGAGWDAFVAVYGGFMIAHGYTELCKDFEKQWDLYKASLCHKN